MVENTYESRVTNNNVQQTKMNFSRFGVGFEFQKDLKNAMA